MPFEMPGQGYQLVKRQRDVISRLQGKQSGLTDHAIDGRLRTGHWRRVHRGVYAVVTGHLGREAQLWAALLRAGEGAVLSHYTAAELHGLSDQPSELIHITVPQRRDPARRKKIEGVVIHRSDLIARTRHPARTLPVTRVEETVVDLINDAMTFDAAYDWICKAIGRGTTTAGRILNAVNSRGRVRWRQAIKIVLADASGGAISWLELRYVRGVERPHGLPKAMRQVRIRQDCGPRYLDNLYDGYLVCVELDGVAAHPRDEQRRDKERDNWNLINEKIVTLRLGVPHVRTPDDCCTIAAGIVKLLGDRGPAVGHPCQRPACPVGRPEGTAAPDAVPAAGEW
jgi:transcriptional regulator with AbiEi antitoxin domain of type IV toxin-antitoxin system